MIEQTLTALELHPLALDCLSAVTALCISALPPIIATVGLAACAKILTSVKTED